MKLRLLVLAGFVAMVVSCAIAATQGQWAGAAGPFWFLVGLGYYHVKMGEGA